MLFPYFLNSQNINYSVENLFIDDGFPIIRILDINQDSDGLIWICSEEEIYSFNGSQFELEIEYKNHDLKGVDLLFDNNGNKWFIQKSIQGDVEFYPNIKKISIYNDENKNINGYEYLNLDLNQIKSIYQNKEGVLIFPIDSTFYSFDKKLEKLNIPKRARSLIYSDERIAIINNENYSEFLNSKTFKSLKKFDHLIRRARVFENLIYIQTSSGELYRYDINTNEIKFFSDIMLRRGSISYNFILNEYGQLWVVDQRGIFLYNELSELIYNPQSEKKNNALPYVTTSFKDVEENVWIGTNLGLNKITSHQNPMFRNSEPFNFSTRSIHQINDDELFVSTYDGDFIYNMETSDYFNISETNVIYEIIEEDGMYYVATRNNVIRKESFQPKKVYEEVHFDCLYPEWRHPPSLIKTSLKKKYMLLYHSIYEFDNALNFKEVYENKTQDTIFNRAYEFNKEVYVLTDKGACVYDLNFNKKKNILPGYVIKVMHQDRDDSNILWLSTRSQLIKYNIKKESYKEYDSTSGFINTNFTAIDEDKDGNIWLPSYTGINKFNKWSEENQLYLAEAGLSNNEFNNFSYSRLKDSIMVFGSISGLTFVDAEHYTNKPISNPNINIYSCEMLASNQPKKINVTNEVNHTSKLIFKEQYIEAELALAHYSYTNLKSKIFRYRIYKKDDLPSHESWTKLVSNTIQLGRMPYGEYVLEYDVQSRYGNKLSKINQIQVQYLKPWYKSWLTILLGLGLLVFGIYYFIQKRSELLIKQKLALESEVEFRTQQIQKQKQELENLNNTKDKLFSILAHDLKSPLITLKNISGKINYLIKKGQPDRIIEIGKTIEEKVSNLNIFLDNLLNWALQQRGHLIYKPTILSIQKITEEILILFDDIIQEKDLTIHQNIPVNASCYADENSLKTVVRNIIHNAIKYSPKSNIVSIKFSRGTEYNTLAISDNGAGIPQAIIDAVYKKEYIKNTPGTSGEKGTGLGFMISKELMDLNNSKIVFLTNEGIGTTVELLLPIEEYS